MNIKEINSIVINSQKFTKNLAGRSFKTKTNCKIDSFIGINTTYGEIIPKDNILIQGSFTDIDGKTYYIVNGTDFNMDDAPHSPWVILTKEQFNSIIK